MNRVDRTSLWLLPALCLAGLAANVSGRTVEPLVTILATDLAVSVGAAALLTSLYALPFALGQPLLGPLGDIYGKALVLKISVTALACSLLVAAFAPNFEVLAIARFCAGFAAGGVVPACMATIGDAYSPERRQVAISTFVTMGLLAQIFATSASGMVGEAFGWRFVLFGTAAFGIIGALAAMTVLPRKVSISQSFSLGLVLSNYRSVFQNPKAVLCYSTVFLEGVGLYGALPYIGSILIEKEIGAAREAGFIIGALGVGGLVYVSLVRQLLKRWTRPQFMAVGGFLMMSGLVALALIDDWRLIAASFGVSGFGFMLLHNSIQTESVDLAPDARQSAYSLHALSFFTGQASGPPLFGLCVMALGSSLSLIISAVILAVTGLAIGFLFHRIARRSALTSAQ
jgi:predicted MFS family arabinose efflux permease